MNWHKLLKRPKKDLEWIADLPDESDRKVLHNMLNRGTDLNMPREMFFTMFATESGAKKIAAEAPQGWEPFVQSLEKPQIIEPDGPELNISIEFRQDNYVIGFNNFTSDQIMFQKLAVKYGGYCDGWYASS